MIEKKRTGLKSRGTGKPDYEKQVHRSTYVELIETIKLLKKINHVELIEAIKLLRKINVIDKITEVALINLIKKILEIGTIKYIESVGSMPDITTRGSEGVAFRQVIAGAGAWVKPTGFEDPDTKWDDEAKAYDTDDETFAYSDVASGVWGSFIVLTIASVRCSKVRFRASEEEEAGLIDVDVLKDGSWADVYTGVFDYETDIEKVFSEGAVTKLRFRFYYEE